MRIVYKGRSFSFLFYCLIVTSLIKNKQNDYFNGHKINNFIQQANNQNARPFGLHFVYWPYVISHNNDIAMKFIVAVFLILYLTGCKTTKKRDFELISYFWSYKEKAKNDTLDSYVRPYMYARINNNGNCMLIINDKNNSKQFKSIDIDKRIICDLLLKVKMIDNDTVLRNVCKYEIYDGPAIKIFVFNHEGKPIKISFDNSSRSDLDFRKFYNYLDSISLKSPLSNTIDTTSLLDAQNRLIENIYETDKRLVPLMVKDDTVEDE